MTEPGKGRSRGRGRARGQIREHERGNNRPQYPPSEPSTSSGWPRRFEHSFRAATSSAPYVKPSQPTQIVGQPFQPSGSSRGGDPGHSLERPPEKMEVTPCIGAGGDAPVMGRGGLRAKQMLPPELLSTKPQNLSTKQGDTGNRIIVQANYFKLLSSTDWCLYKYAVDFAPEEDRIFVRKGLLRLHKEKFGAYIFDGSVMYTSCKLNDIIELFSVRQSDNTKIRITVRFVEQMCRGDYHYLQFFNIIMRKCLSHLDLQLIGRNFFDPHNKIEVEEYKFELWPGYFTSIRQHENDILLCAEITHKIMRRETLLEMLRNIWHESKDNYQQRFKSEVLGLVVLTHYNNNTYKIDDVDFSVTPLSTFRLQNGEEITYKDYYKQKYEIRIRNDTQPMLVTKSKPKDRRAGKADLIYLVPELCCPTGLTERMREDFQLMRVLSEHTRVAPQGRINRLLQFHRRLKSVPAINQEFKDWNLELDNKLIDVPARILPSEKIIFANTASATTNQEADWTRDLRQKPLLKSHPLRDWIVICPQRVQGDLSKFISQLIKAAAGMNFDIKAPRVECLQDDRSGAYAQKLENILSQYRPQIIFCVVSNNRSERYSAIKKKCCIDRPIPTQVFLQRNLNSRGAMSIATKVAIQMNCKLGGAPWSLNVPLSGLMVVGFDVCHDPKQKGRDFGAMVASLDKHLTRYFSVVETHSSGEEVSNHIATNLVMAVQKYRTVHDNALPEHIVIYRDGVGEGQLSHVSEYEVKRIRAQLAELYGNAPLKMAFVVVTKRINTRLFFRNANTPPGTVVDDVITNPVKYDFFLVSQNVRQGTVTPTYYNVIDDTLCIGADKLQRLSYKLTHMYFNWSGTVRVPAPCQYAHKLAFLVSQFIHSKPSVQLDTLLYFL